LDISTRLEVKISDVILAAAMTAALLAGWMPVRPKGSALSRVSPKPLLLGEFNDLNGAQRLNGWNGWNKSLRSGLLPGWVGNPK